MERFWTWLRRKIAPPQPNVGSSADVIAAQIALAALVRVAIGEVAFTENREMFRRRLSAIDVAANATLGNDRLFAGLNAADPYIKEAASGWITALIASIRHPSDDTSN